MTDGCEVMTDLGEGVGMKRPAVRAALVLNSDIPFVRHTMHRADLPDVLREKKQRR